MGGWGAFAAALAVFLLSHAIPVRPPVRPWLVARLGLRGYLVAYSLLSLAVLYWLIVAAGAAPYVEVIPPLPILRWVPMILMPVVCLIAVAGMRVCNPLSFGGMGQGPFDPDALGVLAFSRHPLPLALALWSLAHLLANGDLAHVLLFGLFAGFAMLGMRLIDRRKQRDMGRDWHRLAANTRFLSLRHGAELLRPVDMMLAGALFGILLFGHVAVIGVSPMP
ncbi:NnrU family protein [Ruegeria sp. WL0004]|uniref:NnrU family protein n=1 Tax=Ruegeria marisflavi TaxID=2984152 RepID=A0ABT2WXY6_9RHOB|nr:NnrU family protein [Ruegeria sp. WL0004]MCU9840117.1 NnrU family protein [Ruegeria sp. WL0004]